MVGVVLTRLFVYGEPVTYRASQQSVYYWRHRRQAEADILKVRVRWVPLTSPLVLSVVVGVVLTRLFVYGEPVTYRASQQSVDYWRHRRQAEAVILKVRVRWVPLTSPLVLSVVVGVVLTRLFVYGEPVTYRASQQSVYYWRHRRQAEAVILKVRVRWVPLTSPLVLSVVVGVVLTRLFVYCEPVTYRASQQSVYYWRHRRQAEAVILKVRVRWVPLTSPLVLSVVVGVVLTRLFVYCEPVTYRANTIHING